MQEVVDPFLGFLRSLLEPFGLGNYAEVIALIPYLIVLYMIYLIVMRSITISFRKVRMPMEAISGVRLLVRLLFFGVALSTVLAAATIISGTALITGGAIFGTAIGLAFSRALSNMVSGFYVLGARPFRVGDYVRIGDAEGVILEIALNYTRLLLPDMTQQVVPNSKVVDSEVTNFRIRAEELMHQRGVEEHLEWKGKSFKSALGGLKKLAKGTEVFRYTFDVQVSKEYNMAKVEGFMNGVIDRHAGNFIERPELMYWANTSIAVTYRVAFIVTDPMQILGVGANIQADIVGFHDYMKTSNT